MPKFFWRSNYALPLSFIVFFVIEKDKQTTAYWDGKILPVSGEAQNWVEKNRPGAL